MKLPLNHKCIQSRPDEREPDQHRREKGDGALGDEVVRFSGALRVLLRDAHFFRLVNGIHWFLRVRSCRAREGTWRPSRILGNVMYRTSALR